MDYKLTAESHSLPFLRPSVSEMYAEKTADDIHCRFSNKSFVMDRTTMFSENMSQDELLVKNYLESKNPWMVADFGEITETDDDGMNLSIHSKDATVDIVFNNPDDTSSRIFELASCFGYENPYNLQSERLQLAPVTVVDDIPYRHNFWAIRKDRGNKTRETQSNLFTRLGEMLSSVVS